MLKSRVAKNQPVIDIPNVTYEQIVVSQRFMKLMNQICSLMETAMRHRAGESGLPIGLPRR